MKHLQFIFHEMDTFSSELQKIRLWCNQNLYSTVLLHLLTDTVNKGYIEEMLDTIKEFLPQALVVGCSTNGNIVHGDYSGSSTAVSCLLFEYPSTRVGILQYPLSNENQEWLAKEVIRKIEEKDWVKGMEMLATIRGMSMTQLCESLTHVKEGIHIFGGGALSSNLNTNAACVFSSVYGYLPKGVVFIFYGGEDLHLDTRRVTGWKPLGSYFTVTAAKDNYLQEINHSPAYATYQKYLQIRNDENFFSNTREFPLFYHLNGIDILRAPIASNPDGSLTMTSDVNVNVKARLAYGDPQTILSSAWEEAYKLLSFSPECILVFSCAGRRTFWGNADVGRETEPYEQIAPTFGFYTSGEFLRTNGYLNQHNVTQVVASMREGIPVKNELGEETIRSHVQEGKYSMIRRLATFINVTTRELEEANQKLKEANTKLSELAVVDALTGIGNRNAYFERVKEVEEAIAQKTSSYGVAVFDLNGLKSINDELGHEYGDQAIASIGKILSHVFQYDNVFRIGGDEFIALLPRATEEMIQQAFLGLEEALAEKNRQGLPFLLCVSKGFSIYEPGCEADYQSLVSMADENMYADKAQYYKTHERKRR